MSTPSVSCSIGLDLHVFFLPFPAPGHMIPMVDLARLFASRGARASIVTTTANVALTQPTVDLANAGATLPHPIQLLALRFPCADVGLPEGYENISSFRDPDVVVQFVNATDKLEAPFYHLVASHRPDCIVAECFYPWTTAFAREFGIPRLAFHGSSYFFSTVLFALRKHKLGETDQPFELPGLPHRVKFNPMQLPDFLIRPDDHVLRMGESARECHGTVMNSFYDPEREFIDLAAKCDARLWCVGPVSLHIRHETEKAVRASDASTSAARCLKWLDGKMQGSVLYLCFGSQSRFTAAQLREIARGLEASEQPFVWVMRDVGEPAEWLSEGFEERMLGREKGLIVQGWAPQLLILNHEAVGGFVTHCGWNSCLEAMSAGVPVITWPLFAEQFINEKLLVQIRGVGVAIGVTACRGKAEERELVKEERLKEAVEELMGEGEEAEEFLIITFKYLKSY